MRAQLAIAARNISQLLQGEGQDSVSIGQFTGPPQSSSGPGIVKLLAEEFAKLGVNVKKVARIGVKGEFSITEVDDPQGSGDKVMAVKIHGSIVDQFGKVLTEFDLDNVKQGEFEQVVPDHKTVIEAAGMTVSLPLKEDVNNINPATRLKERDQQIADMLTNPRAHLAESSKLSATPQSPYAIEILVGSQPRVMTMEDGLAFCQIHRGEAYEIRIYNQSNLDAAVQLTIDGLSDFSFSELRYTDGPQKGQPLYNHWIVPAHQSSTVAGWHRTNGRWDSFLVTEYAKSAAAELQHTSDIGTITATFCAAWPKGGLRPVDEPPAGKGLPLATGFGPPKQVNLQPVEREVGVVRAALTVRYSKPTD